MDRVADNTAMGFLTDFEYSFVPLKKMDIDDYERRIKKFVEPDCENLINERQLVESFNDHVYLKGELQNKQSPLRKLMLNDTFAVKPGQYSVPWLLLLGILYCASNVKVRALKFYELCQSELEAQISSSDRDLKANLKKMMEISYWMMLAIYKGEGGQAGREEWLGTGREEEVMDEIYEGFLDEQFGTQSKKPCELFVGQLQQKQQAWLQPH